MSKERYTLTLKGKIIIILYAITVVVVLSLILLNCLALASLENIETINISTTIIASVTFIIASILQVSRVILKKQHKNNEIFMEDVLSWGLTVALCFLALRIVLNGDKYIYTIYTAVMAITLILFLTKEMFAISFVEEKSRNYVAFKILLYTLIFSLAIVYIVLFFNALFEKEIASQIITIIASILGGLLTLSGVAWTIKSNNKDRKADLERIENERKEEERKRAKPYFALKTVEYHEIIQLNCLVRFYDGWDDEENNEMVKFHNRIVAKIINSPLSVSIVEKIYHDNRWWDAVANKTILPKDDEMLEFYSNTTKNIFLQVCDVLGNNYYYELILLNQDFILDGMHFYTIKEFREVSNREIHKITNDTP
ncbi:MAG: hypothetical protein IKB98_04150 [Clostridia bacterium]|nr:hypothetical protein [Clostridia bacterium]